MADNSTRLCPACGRALESGTAPAACLRCQNLYHQECWDGLTRCLSFGCASSPRETVADLDHPPPPRQCSSCEKENPPDCEVCLSCGERLVECVPRAIFTSSAGWQAETPEALMEELDRHWETGVQHLYHGHVECWLAGKEREDLSDAARQVRTTNTQHSVGLEAFLQSTGLVSSPLVEVTPTSLDLEGPGPTVSAALEVRNAGRGYLSGQIRAEASWLEIEPHEFAGNRVRVMVIARVSELSEGPQEASLFIHTPAGDQEVPVTGRRIALADAVSLFRQGETVAARTLCRKLMESHAGSADASILLAAAYLEEDNTSSAVHALRNMAGACQSVPSDIVEKVFRYLEEGDPAASGVERLEIYERLIPCAEGPLGVEIRRTLAGLAMERARMASGAVKSAGGGSLWKGRTATTDDVVELLQMAAAYDSSLAQEATTLQKQLRGRVTRGKVAVRLGGLILLGALVAAGFGSWAWNKAQTSRIMENAEVAYQAGRYRETATLLRDLEQTGVQLGASRKYLALAYAQMGRSEEEEGQAEQSRGHFEQAFGMISDPEVKDALASLLTEWAQADMTEGRAGEARVRLEQALQIAPDNQKVQTALAPIKSETDLYWKVHQLAESALGQQTLEDYASLGAVASQVEDLVNLGLEPYQTRMMVSFADVTGTGDRELVVAGTVGDPMGNATGHYAIYDLAGSRLRKVDSGTIRPTPILSLVQTRDLTGDGKADLIIQWLARTPDDPGATVLLGYSGGKLVKEDAPTSLPLDLGDRNADGRTELWIPQVAAESTGSGDRVLFYEPFLWNAPGFTKAPGDFTQYYRDYKVSLENQLQDNPYPAEDPRYEQYRQDRLKAIAMAERLIQGR